MSKGDEKKMITSPLTFLPFDSESERMGFMWPPPIAYLKGSIPTACPNCLRLKKLAATMKRAKVPQARSMNAAREHRQTHERTARFTTSQFLERNVSIGRLMQDFHEKMDVADLTQQMSRIMGGFRKGDGRQPNEKSFNQ
ncbi:hypothetical protein OSTOST_11694 [Ostertagia ostertagi]